MWKCVNLTSLEGIDNLTNLKELIINWAGISDISLLSMLTRLKTLDLSGCECLESLDGIGNLADLEELILSNTNSVKGQGHVLHIMSPPDSPLD